MFNFLNALLQACRESLMPTPKPTTCRKPLEGSLQDLILGACADQNFSRIHSLDKWHELLFEQAAKSGSVETLQQLLDRYGTTTELTQLTFAQAAQYGNAAVFKFLLQQQPEPVISDDVRSRALEGGVEIWKVILEHKPELINYDFGEKGDLIAMATLMNNVPLLRFFLAEDLDPNNSRLFTQPIIDIASATPSIKPEILDLLLQYGATKEKSQTANKNWRMI